MTRLSDAMDSLADREARADLAIYVAAWFASADPAGCEQAVAAWEAMRR